MLDLWIAQVIWSQKDNDEIDNGGHDNGGTGRDDGDICIYDDEVSVCFYLQRFCLTRPKPACGRQGLDWIIGPGYSLLVFSTNKTMETNQKPW